MHTPPPTDSLPAGALKFYFRQSLGEDKQASIPTQRSEVHSLARRLGFSDEQIAAAEANAYKDVDRSGTDFAGRGELDRLLADTAAGHVILTWRFSRLGRDIMEGGHSVREIVQRRKAQLFTVDTGSAPVKWESAADMMMTLMQFYGPQAEVEATRKNTRSGLRQRAREGHACGPVPFGYTTVLVDPTAKDPKKTKKNIVRVEDRLALVRRIALDLYVAKAKGPAAIAHLLNDEGILTANGKQWAPMTIAGMLREPAYAGHWSYGVLLSAGRQGDKRIRERADEADIIRSERPDLAIFTADEWALIQTTIAKRRREMPAGMNRPSMALLSGGRLRCYCGGSMMIRTESRRGWSRRYYVCASRRHGARCDNKGYLPAGRLEAAVVDDLRAPGRLLDQLEAYLVDSIHKAAASFVADANARTASADRLQSEIDTLRKERQRLVGLAAACPDIAEVTDALRTNQTRASKLDRQLAVAQQEPVAPAMVAKLEASARATIADLRDRLEGPHASSALAQVFAGSLRLTQPATPPDDTDGPPDGPGAPAGAPGPDAPSDGQAAAIVMEGEASLGSLPIGNATDLDLVIAWDRKIPYSLTVN